MGDLAKHPRRLRLLSYNIQVGSQTSRYRHYVTKSWRQIIPNRTQLLNLDAISELIADYDFVGLQEVDGGSFRSSFINQTRYLAGKSGFEFWFSEPNRNVGQLAKHSNGLLTRYKPSHCRHIKLPGVPGRGLLLTEFDYGEENLAIIVVHLALGGRSQKQQFDVLLEMAGQYKNCIIMGDFNREPHSQLVDRLLTEGGLTESCCHEPTYPSWSPQRKIDYILVSRGLEVLSCEVINYPLSDHLPIQLDVQLPDTIQLAV
jgi:endonuclease/exonuclease/phosphatase family metal-dependent hydrolase